MKKVVECKFIASYSFAILFFLLDLILVVIVAIYGDLSYKGLILIFSLLTTQFLTLYFYLFANTTLRAESDGIRVLGGLYRSYSFTIWEELKYAYYTHDIKNNRIWVISSSALNKKQLSRVTNWPRNFYGCYKDKVYTIPIVHVKDVDGLKEIIENKIEHIEYLCE